MGFPIAACRRRLLLSFVGALMLATPLFAVEKAAEGDQPISIEANRMVSQENQNSVIFLGKVDARQGTLTIRAEEMTVFYSEEKVAKKDDKAEKPTNKVEGMSSQPGQVRKVSGNQVAASAPAMICPSPPMLITLARKAIQMPSPTSSSGVAFTSVCVMPETLPNAPLIIWA